MTETAVDPKPHFATVGRTYYPIIVALFTATLIISNVCATKGIEFFGGHHFSLGPVQILPLNLDAAFFLFPLAYILGDVLTEVYGFAAARRAILTGFAIMLLTTACFAIAVRLPAASWYENQQAFSTVVGTVPWIVGASVAGYLVGQLLNSYVLVWIKARTKERFLWVRLIGSTVVGELADTVTFCAIAAPAIGITTISGFINYVVVGYVWKTLAEVIVLPITYRVIALIKAHEPTYAY